MIPSDSIATLFIPRDKFHQIRKALKETKIKHKPFRATDMGYYIDIYPKNSPLISYLLLTYDINS